MGKKELHLILAIFSLIVFCAVALLFMGCSIDYMTDPQYRARVDEEYSMERIKRKAAEEEAKEEEQTEAEQAAPNEEAAEAEEKEISFPDEQVTYTGKISGLASILTVNFKTTVVTGSIDNVSDYPDYIISDGKIDLDTLEITAKVSGILGRDEKYGEETVEILLI